MNEHKGLVAFQGNPLTLLGDLPGLGQPIPDATLLDNDLNEVRLSSFSGRVLIIASVPSLDTPVCSVETRKFNQKASELGTDVQILVVSMDLPFAQKRWCAAEGIDRVKTLSDHRTAEFGLNYGVLIKELRLLARVIFLADRDQILRYVHIVPDITHEPDYDQVLVRTKSLLDS